MSLRELGIAGVGAGVLQFALALWMDATVVFVLLGTWAYFGLMCVEFFVPDWLDRHSMVYMLSHVVIMPGIALLASACDWAAAGTGLPKTFAWFLGASFFGGLVFEIGRKIRAPEGERTGVETYSKEWGRTPAVIACLGHWCWPEERLQDALSGHPLRRWITRWVLKHAQRRVADRENLRFERTRVFGVCRRIFVGMGRRLHAEDLLDDPRDVFYLEVNEVLGVVEGTASTTDLQALVQARREEFERYREELPAPPDRFRTRGSVHAIDLIEPDAGDESPKGDSAQMSGLGCCPGTVEGPVRVVDDPRDASLEGHEILVAKRTDPGWITLFATCCGLLVEQGNLLSHAAIGARERGIPAVVFLPGITDRLQDGDVVRLDGSTGAPKGAVRTHGLLRAQYEALRDNLDLRPGQIDLATLPVFVLANLVAGVTTVLADADLRAPAQIDPEPVVEQIQTERPTRTTASPAVFERLMDADESVLDRFDRLYTGGAPVFPDLLNRMRSAAPSSEIVAVYGSTEAEPIAHVAEDEIRPEDRQRMVQGGGLLAGRPVDEVELQILPDRWGTPIGPFSRDELEAEACPPNTPGEIVVTGPHVAPGYLDGRGDEENKFEVDGTQWHRTGDAGWLDVDGRLWLLGRFDATVSDDRGTLYPFAVECGARLHDDVRHAALAQWQGRRVLVVEPTSTRCGVDRQDLQDQLANVSLDEIVVLSSIPLDRRHNAKVDYPALYDRLEQQL